MEQRFHANAEQHRCEAVRRKGGVRGCLLPGTEALSALKGGRRERSQRVQTSRSSAGDAAMAEASGAVSAAESGETVGWPD